MSRLARIVPVLAALVCGALAGRVLSSPVPEYYLWAESALPAALVTNGAGVAAAAVVAVLVTAALVRRRSVTLVTAAVVAGLLLLALPDVFRYPDEPAVLLYSNAVAAGVVLGAVSPLAARELSAQAALAVGAVGAFLLSGAVAEVSGGGTADFGWTAYTPLTSQPVERSSVVGLWPVVVAAALVVLTVVLDRRTSWGARVDTRWAAIAAALPVAAFAAARILTESAALPQWWYPYVGLVTALVAWLAWQLPGRDGQLVFAGAAILAAAAVGTPWTSGNWWAIVVPAALIVAGAAVGLRWPLPAVGFGLLAVAAAICLLGPDHSDVSAFVYAIALPAGVGYVVGSCLPTSAPASTVGLSLPFCIAIPGVVAAAGTTSARYADYLPDSGAQLSTSTPVVLAAVSVVVVCGVGAWGLGLRSGVH
ncbi:hypothetical protein A6F55_23160 [Prescottella equi]|uniref:hypothetical protein n=1 Tax=Rhodococcus hoagii TaxID=43767 RepID=UPI000A102D54|nr:hypothetical protein [Prescottella equi]MBU4616104.1 hypothetical protein [Rhodococcus sp. GG48]ORJ93818.1 hypothetical protein A6F55_23160 [Prescottella equi]ORL73471.1 hypothetical protein A5905_21020 [Prescottella equi]BCN63341.1 hypothetical protein RE9431_17960 [Prescottella equi]BCN73192.1 hypothetical protein RE0327_17910 [Prescottella equi]